MNETINLKACIVLQYAHHYVIESNKEYYQKIETKLVIERATSKVVEVKDHFEIVGSQKLEKRFAFTLFLGILAIYDQNFLFFVAECTKPCKIDSCDVFSISKTACLSLEVEKNLNAHSKSEKIFKHLNELKNLLSKFHYFSFQYNLTTSKNCLSKGLPTQENKYAWNYYIFSTLLQQGISKNWLVPLIQGYVGSFTVTIASELFVYSLISRRGFANGGTRYYSRGLDDNGNCANWVEHEQIIHFGKYVFAHIQARGSAPLFFEQTGLTANINISRPFAITRPIFHKHITFLKDNYNKTLFVNLMSTTRNNEQKLTDVYEELIKAGNYNFIRYEFFDFHAVVGDNYTKLNPIITKIEVLHDSFKFYLLDKSQNKVMCTQQGIIRTNCLDCLDRTNAFQAKVAMAAVEYILKVCSIDLSKTFKKRLIELLDEKNEKVSQFITLFKNMWADQGDSISKLYAGTGSLTSSVTRTGKKTISGFFDHKLKTINRFFKGHLNFEDKKKQRAIDLLTGGNTENINIFEESLNDKLKKRIREFTTSSDYKLYVLSWNVCGSDTKYNPSINLFSEFENNDFPDLIIICLQEIINLDMSNVVINTVTTANEGEIGYWKNIMFSQLSKYKQKVQYYMIDCKSLAGICLMILIQEKHREKVGHVQYDTVKLGWKGTVPDKGAVVIKINIEDTCVCVSGLHLTAGQTKSKCASRLENFTLFHEKAFQLEGQIGKRKQAKIEKSDYSIILGDLNFRLEMAESEASTLINKLCSIKKKDPHSPEIQNILNKLISFDQFYKHKDNHDYLKKYNECPINFLPTYKFETNSNEYNVKNSRTPSWTDRILYWSPSDYQIKALNYQSKENVMISDHRPVIALLTIEILTVNKEKRDNIIKQILLKEGINEREDDNPAESTILDNKQFSEESI